MKPQMDADKRRWEKADNIGPHPLASAAPGKSSGIQVPVPVAEALTRFAELDRRLAIWEAAGWVLAALVFALTLIAFSDCFFLVGQDARKLASTAAYLICLLLGAPLLARAFRRRSPAEIARALELRVPGQVLEERVSTTVELAGRNMTCEGISQQLVERVADESAHLINTLSIAALPDRTRARRAGKAGLSALAAVLVLCSIPGPHMASFYLRALLPWGHFSRPSSTTVAVSPGNTRVVEGAQLEVEARLGGRLVKDAWLESREQDSSAWTRLQMDPDAEQPARFTLKTGPLRSSLEYRVRAGDCLTDGYEVALLPCPEIAGLKFVVTYPAYTGMAPETLERISGDLAVLKGSRIAVTLSANTALAAAVLDFASGRKVSMAVKDRAATATFDVIEDTQYRALLRSNEGVENLEAPLFAIHAIPDRPPQVAVFKPSSDESVDAGQLLSLEARAEDDLGLVSCRLVVRTDMRPGATVIKLERPPESGKVWLIVQPWDLAGMFLQDGETVFYQVEAIDTAGATGRSDERRLRVASGRKREPAQVLAALERAQKSVSSAHRLLTGARKDIAEMRQLFRPQDVEFQAAERLLLTETFRRIGSEATSAAATLEKITPQVESGPLRLLLAALHNALERLGGAGLRPLVSGAAQARLPDSVAVAAGLEVLRTFSPETENRLISLHQALTAAHRYSGATLLAERAADVRDAQEPITPVLVGAAGWSTRGTYTPGLLGEYYRGQNLEQLARRTVEPKIEHKNEDLPEVGRSNFSVRWKGEVLAPQSGRYVFRVTADDGVRLSVAGKQLIDEWHTEAAATPFEGAVELTEGWHEMVLTFFQDRGDYEISLTRSGPKEPGGPIPPEQLRHGGTPLTLTLSPQGRGKDEGATGDDVRKAMTQGASTAAVQQALLRLQTMVKAASGLGPELARLASLPPERDTQGRQEAAEWGKETARNSAELVDVSALNPALALPLSQWREHTKVLATHYQDVRKRYRAAVEEWLRKLGADVFEESARLRELQQEADAAKKAFESLAEAARRPPLTPTLSPQGRGQGEGSEMARADATVRALAGDLQKQAGEIAAEFAAAAQETRRPLEERRLLQALEHRAEEMAHDPAAALEKRLNEARTAEELAKTQEKIPNFAANAAELSKQAGELAQWTEKMERAVGLREALQETAKDALAARDALNEAPTAKDAAEQQRAASELRQDATELAQALETARNAVGNDALAKAQQAVEQARNTKAPGVLEQRAAKTLAALPAPRNDADTKAAAEAGKELAAEAQKATAAAAAVNKDLANAAQQLNGDAAQALRQTAQHLQAENQALSAQPGISGTDSQFPNGRPLSAASRLGVSVPEIQQAADAAEAAREKAQNTAERLGLDAEAARKDAKTDAERNRADDLVGLAAAVRNEAEQQLKPAAEGLMRAQRAANQTPQANQPAPMPQAERAQAAAQAQREAQKMNKLADVASQLNSPDANQQKAAHEALEKLLAEQGAAPQVAEALKQGAALDKMAGDAAQAAELGISGTDSQFPNGRKLVSVPEIEQALAAAMQADPAQAERAALGERLGELAQDLRQQAAEDRQLAGHLEQAAGQEQQAREHVKKESPALAKAFRDAQRNAAQAAKGQGPEAAQPLESAQKGLAQEADATESQGAKADSAPLPQLAQALNNIAQNAATPLGEIASALNKSSAAQMQYAQRAGQQARQAAGREAELATELTNAQRAEQVAQAEAQAEAGDRAALEAQVHAALQALDKPGAMPAAQVGQAVSLPLVPQAGQPAPPGAQPGTPATAEQARENGERMGQMAEQLDKLANALQADTAGATDMPSQREGLPVPSVDARMSSRQTAGANTPVAQTGKSSSTPAADALRALAQAEAAQQTGAQAQAAAKAQQAATALGQAAEAAREQASGVQSPASAEAQRMAQNQGKSQGQAQGKGQQHGPKLTQGQDGAKGAYTAQSKGSLPPEPPQGIPIDKTTWNRLPDNLRRDLLNAAGERFPAEYEASIKRYFKNLAADKEKGF